MYDSKLGTSKLVRNYILMSLGLCLASSLDPRPANAGEESEGVRTVRVTEVYLRSLVERSAMPNLAGLALPPDSGPAVAEVMVSSRGKVVAISILEAPTFEIAQALQVSLRSWSFRPVDSSSAALKVGKLTFYFKVVDHQLVGVDTKMAGKDLATFYQSGRSK
jgi:hypothetical protein